MSHRMREEEPSSRQQSNRVVRFYPDPLRQSRERWIRESTGFRPGHGRAPAPIGTAADHPVGGRYWTESSILAQDERWRRA